MALKDIVKVTISRETTAVARASFGIPCIVAEFATSKTSPAFTRARVYGGLDEMTAEGWLTTDAVYKVAQAMLKQNPRVSSFVVGRKDTADADTAVALAAIQLENDSWYALTAIPDGTFATDVKAIAAWIETQKKIYFVQGTDTAILNGASTTDLLAELKALGYDRTALIYHLAANSDEYAEAAWVGEGLPFDPGSSTWAFKQLAGVTPDSLTTANRTGVLGKNGNAYSITAGVAITEQGKVVSGEFIDIIIGLDYLESRLQENVFGALVNARKLPYDDGGITAISGIVQATLEEAARKGILQGNSIVLTVPKYSEIPQADKLARNLPDIKFTALLLGAIQTIEINGTVSV